MRTDLLQSTQLLQFLQLRQLILPFASGFLESPKNKESGQNIAHTKNIAGGLVRVQKFSCSSDLTNDGGEGKH